MGILLKYNGLRMIEPVPAPEVFVSGVGRVDVLAGDNVRLWCYADQSVAEDQSGTLHKVVVLKVIRSVSELTQSCDKVQEFLRQGPRRYG